MKKMFLSLVCICTVIVAGGCSGSFDASKYVEGIMNNVYKGDSALYQAYVDITSEEAQTEYEEGIASEIDLLLYAFEIDDISESVRSEFVDFYKEVYKQAKYEVKNETKEGNTYKVEVIISPIDVISKSFDEMSEAYAEMSQEESDVVAEKLLDILNQHKANLGYMEDKSITVTVKEDSEGMWGISDEDFLALDEYILSYE